MKKIRIKKCFWYFVLVFVFFKVSLQCRDLPAFLKHPPPEIEFFRNHSHYSGLCIHRKLPSKSKELLFVKKTIRTKILKESCLWRKKCADLDHWCCEYLSEQLIWQFHHCLSSRSHFVYSPTSCEKTKKSE